MNKNYCSVAFLISLGFLTSPVFAQHNISVENGNVSQLETLLSSRDSITIDLWGTFNFSNPITITGKKGGISLNGRGCVWNVSPSFSFGVDHSKNVNVSGIIINETGSGARDDVFSFISDTTCTLLNISYSSPYAWRTFASFTKGSYMCSVKECRINGVTSAILFGNDNDVNADLTPNQTTDCIAENNVVDGYVTRAIAVRDPWASRDLFYASGNSMRSRIAGNIIKHPNMNHDSCKADNFGCIIGIEVWGSDCTVENNNLETVAGENAYMGISLAEGARTICINNRIRGPFLYQGIEMQLVHNSIISGNYLDGILQSTELNNGGIGVSANSGTMPNPPYDQKMSSNNIITNNMFLNCGRGIKMGWRSKYTEIVGNVFSGNTAAIVGDGGGFAAKWNTFMDNFHAYRDNQDASLSPVVAIFGNDFINETETVVWSEVRTSDPSVRTAPVNFHHNLVFGWGDAGAPSALVLGAKNNSIVGNYFLENAGRSFGIIALKDKDCYMESYTFKDNLPVSTPLTLDPTGIPDWIPIRLNFDNVDSE
jgi:hypothetical protein